MSLSQLHQLAKEKGIKGISKMRKSDLMEALEHHLSTPPPTISETKQKRIGNQWHEFLRFYSGETNQKIPDLMKDSRTKEAYQIWKSEKKSDS